MKIELVCAGDPLVLVGKIPASCKSERQQGEHEAGLRLLNYGMSILNLPVPPIKADEHGKPFFSEKGFPCFSISHSSGVAACAISRSDIGCDIEKITRVPRILDKEIDKVRHLASGVAFNSPLGRTTLWTMYEAIAKADGMGIPLDFDSVDSRWHIKTWTIWDSHILTIAMRETKEQCV